jgi:protein SCO1
VLRRTSRAVLGAIGTIICAGAASPLALADAVMMPPMHEGNPVQTMRVAAVALVIPDIQLIRENGNRVSLPRELDDGRAVLVNFIFTTCATICPLSSQTFSVFQDKLGADRDKVHLVSISIDPEQDTPVRLRDYAKQFSAGPNWQHYTGTLAASLAAQRAFGVYRGDKMGHTPVTLLRAAPGKSWRRIDGFATPDDLLREYRAALSAP